MSLNVSSELSEAFLKYLSAHQAVVGHGWPGAWQYGRHLKTHQHLETC